MIPNINKVQNTVLKELIFISTFLEITIGVDRDYFYQMNLTRELMQPENDACAMIMSPSAIMILLYKGFVMVKHVHILQPIVNSHQLFIWRNIHENKLLKFKR
jgi:hypothetical protein